MRRFSKYILLFALILIFVINATGCAEKRPDPSDIEVDASLSEGGDGTVEAHITIVNNSLHDAFALNYRITLLSPEGKTVFADTCSYSGTLSARGGTELATVSYSADKYGEIGSVSVSLVSVSFYDSPAVIGASLGGNVALVAVGIAAAVLLLAFGAVIPFAVIKLNEQLRNICIVGASACGAVAAFCIFTYLFATPFLILTVIFGIAALAVITVYAVIIGRNEYYTNATEWTLVISMMVAPVLALASLSFVLVYYWQIPAIIAALYLSFLFIGGAFNSNSNYEETEIVILSLLTEAALTLLGFFISHLITENILLSITFGLIAAFAFAMLACGFDTMPTVAKLINCATFGTAAITCGIFALIGNGLYILALVGGVVLIFGIFAFLIRVIDKRDYEILQAFGPPAVSLGGLALSSGLAASCSSSPTLAVAIASGCFMLLGAAMIVFHVVYEKNTTSSRRHYRRGRISIEATKSLFITGIVTAALYLILTVLMLAL